VPEQAVERGWRRGGHTKEIGHGAERAAHGGEQCLGPGFGEIGIDGLDA
jgi:hypothetical protein